MQRKNPVPVWVCAVDGIITFAVCFETIADMVLLGTVNSEAPNPTPFVPLFRVTGLLLKFWVLDLGGGSSGFRA